MDQVFSSSRDTQAIAIPRSAFKRSSKPLWVWDRIRFGKDRTVDVFGRSPEALCSVRTLLILSLIVVSGTISGELSLLQKTYAQSTESKSERNQLIDFVISASKNSREQLRNGVFHASGRIYADVEDDKTPLEGDLKIFCAFDFDKNLFRFDQTEPIVRLLSTADLRNLSKRDDVIDSPKVPGAAKDASGYTRVKDKNSGKFIQTAEYSVAWTSPITYAGNTLRETSVGIYPPHDAPPRSVRPFDIRCLGLYFWPDYIQNTPMNKLFDSLIQAEWAEVEESDGVYRLHRKLKGGASHTIWFDSKQEFSPIRMQVNEIAQRSGGHPERPVLTSEVSWKEESSVWVPVSFRIEHRTGGTGRKTSHEMSFEWHSINKPVDPGLFKAERLEVPDSTPILDYRLGKPIQILRHIAVKPPQAVTTQRRWRYFALLGCNFLGVIAIAVLMLRKRRNARKERDTKAVV